MHIIKRQVVELHGLREEDAQQVQQKIAEWVNKQCVPLLDRYLTDLSPDDSMLRLDVLELDLGTIPLDELESGLIDRLDVQLSTQLTHLMSMQDQAMASMGADRPPATHREILNFFVHTGNLPWWTDSSASYPSDPVTESVEYLLKETPNALATDLRSWVAQEAILLRLIRHLPDASLLRIAILNIQLPSASFAGMVTEFSRSFPHIAALSGLPLHRVRETVLLKLLQIAFSASAMISNADSFWEEWLLQVAVALRVKYEPLLQTLREVNSDDRSGFAATLRRLQTGKMTLKTPSGSALEQLVNVLEEVLLPTLDQPGAFREALRHRQSGKLSTAALMKMEDAIKQALEKNDTVGPALINKWTAVLTSLLRNAGLSERLRSKLLTAKNRLQATGFSPLELPTMLDEIARVEDVRVPENAPVETADIKFSESGELFVENAGLVILWPYLTRFYKSLGLLEKEKFSDAAAAHRAAVLLQYLATGQPEVPEYHMALNKILCGLSWDVVLEPGLPLGETEIEECEGLLQAVIANAPVLRNMSPDGLRGSFLLRKGVLRPVAGAWELNVEKATHDVVLEKFPWTWNVVKLPWLEGVLVVEW